MSKTIPIGTQSIQMQMLIELTEQLKLSDAKYDDAKKKYEEVGECLIASNNSVFEDAMVYTQGSVRLGTTVKPYKSNEYDIDLVVHLPYLNNTYSSEVVHELIGKVLRSNEDYEDKLVPLKRGWRINYTDNFHLDITPAIPDNECHNLCPINKDYAEFVPDSKLLDWKASNPRGYANWFHDIDKKMPFFANDSKSLIALESITIEDVPEQHEFKGVLKRTVQLLKRHRDIYFNEKRSTLKEYAPISILITTLAAHAYDDLINDKIHLTAIDLIKSIIANMKNHLEKNDDGFYLANPTNLKENFAEKWNTAAIYEVAFDLWISAAYQDLEKILSSEGLDNVGKAINASFGNNYGNKVIESINGTVSGKRELGVLSGLLALNEGVKANVAKNTFFGA